MNNRFVITNVGTKEKCIFKTLRYGDILCVGVTEEDCEQCTKGKTRAEYEDIIKNEIIHKLHPKFPDYQYPNLEKSIDEQKIFSVTLKDLAKAVVDRLFGEGE